jgi:hypothetical protein
VAGIGLRRRRTNFHVSVANAVGAASAMAFECRHRLDRASRNRKGVRIMDDTKAAEILKSLATGVDPGDGGNMPAVSALQSPDVVRALFLAAETLEARVRLGRRNTNLPRNAGKPWSKEEDDRLLSGFDGGMAVEALATAHQRTRAGIEARLVKHGRLDLEQAGSARIR